MKKTSRENPKVVFIIYEPEHVQELKNYLLEHPEDSSDPFVIVFDKEVEFFLEEARISYRSGREYKKDSSLELYYLAEKWAHQIFQDNLWSFFQYEQVPFTKVFFPPLLAHIQRTLYFVDVFLGIVKTLSLHTRIIIFPSCVITSDTTGYLARREADLPVNCLKVIAENRGFKVEVPKMQLVQKNKAKIESSVFSIKRSLFGGALLFWNIIIRVMRGPGIPRVIVSDYWRNIKPVIFKLIGGEVILLDRKEALNVGILNMWKYRMQFIHPKGFQSGRITGMQSPIRKLFEEKWKLMSADTKYLSDCTIENISLRPILIDVLDDIIRYATVNTLAQVDGTYELLRRYKPDTILLRASVSSQTHFASLAYVGKALGIPAIEIQHGLEYNGPGSGGKRHAAEYVGVYGSLTQKELEGIGFSKDKLPIIGSPRFDIYAAEYKKSYEQEHDASKPGLVVLCIAPVTVFGEYYDTYTISEYFSAIASVVEKIPGAELIIKLRPGSRREGFYRKLIALACKRISYRIVQNEPLLELFQEADVVISNYSTAILESLQCIKPTIVFGVLRLEAQMMRHHFFPYVEAGALLTADNEPELAKAILSLRDGLIRENMQLRIRTFLEQNYAFDGEASSRIREFIKEFGSKNVKNDSAFDKGN